MKNFCLTHQIWWVEQRFSGVSGRRWRALGWATAAVAVLVGGLLLATRAKKIEVPTPVDGSAGPAPRTARRG